MKTRRKAFSILFIFFFVSLACSFPGAGKPNTKASSTPNQTLTALFGAAVEASLTAGATESRVTDTPEATLPPPTEIPSDTPTLIPPTAAPTDTATITPSPAGPTATTTPPAGPTATTTPPAGPTATTTPPATLTGSAPLSTDQTTGLSRSPVFPAAYLSHKPILDGLWDEWNTDVYEANNLTYGAENWANPQDLSASFRVGWDEVYLYVAANINDDVYVQNASGNDLYKGDSLDILLDASLKGDFYFPNLSGDDYQLGISPGRPDVNGKREAYLWYPASQRGSRPLVQIASKRTAGVTTVEALIPWTVFNIIPKANKAFGFVFSVSDNDNSSTNEQQTMVSSSPNRHLTDPTTWGELILFK